MHRLIIQNPVADVIVPFFYKDIRRLPRFGQARSKPATWRATGVEFDGFQSFSNVRTLVFHFLHVLLTKAMTDKFPATLMRCLRYWLVSSNRTSVDCQSCTNIHGVEHVEHSPETNAISVLVPSPIRNIRRGRSPGGRG